MGRPTKLTPELAATVCDYVRDGSYVETAANLAGISKATVYNWLEAGRADDADELHRSFLDAYEKASSEAEHWKLQGLLRGGDGWQAVAWFLERRFRDHWRRDKPDDAANQNAPPQVVVVQVPAGSNVVQQPQQESP